MIDRESEEPVYAQVARRLRELCSDGRLAPGAALPAVRTLASDLGVNLNTVARAYRLLADEGFLTIRGRSGVEVAAPARRAASTDAIEPHLRDLRIALARLRQSGIDEKRMRAITDREIGLLFEERKG
ncbi:MAG: GntR family transcriptional regulator [Acidobacteriota bacterium]